mmetsp:Transcript_13870/g.28627  ORF Transcript_13870/g.28627 Transcript_13870/m.28627 type:complete len:188 (-) Transcript_13870:146-709(-)
MAEENNDDDFAPTTVVIMLGSMNFEPANSVDILSLKIDDPDERAEVLERASKKIEPNTLESVHVLLKASSVSTLFDESILSAFFECLSPGKEVTVHALPESAALADDMAVQPADVDSIRTAILMAGFLLQVEQAHEGSWILSAIKPGGEEESSDEEEEDEDEPTEAEKQEEEEFKKLVNKEMEKEKQ